MGLRLSVQRDAWLRSVDAAAAARPGLVPVVKGNGYGFGRPALISVADGVADASVPLAVGTVHEAADVAAFASERNALVLTPHVGDLPDGLPPSSILTVGSIAHVDALARNGWKGPVVLKLASSMRRFGVEPDELTALREASLAAGLVPVEHGIHLPLAGVDAERRAEIEMWLPHLDPLLPLAVSHLAPETYAALIADHPSHIFRIRCGTSLWHGDKGTLHLSADVLDVHAVRAGDVAGYRSKPVPAGGHLVLVGAGSAHGIRPLDDGRSPFHFARQRVALLEPAHMHTSMLFVPDGAPLPVMGDRIDVQRPLIATTIDECEWLDE